MMMLHSLVSALVLLSASASALPTATRRSESSSLAIDAVHPTTGKAHTVIIDAGDSATGINSSTINVNIHGKRASTSAVVVNPKRKLLTKRNAAVAEARKVHRPVDAFRQRQRRDAIPTPVVDESVSKREVVRPVSNFRANLSKRSSSSVVVANPKRRSLAARSAASPAQAEASHKVHIDASSGGISSSTVNVNVSSQRERRQRQRRNAIRFAGNNKREVNPATVLPIDRDCVVGKDFGCSH